MNSLYKSFGKLVFVLLAFLVLSLALVACSDNATSTAGTNPSSTTSVITAPVSASLTQTGLTPASTDSASSNSTASTDVTGPIQGPALQGSTPVSSIPKERTVINIWTGGWKGNLDYEKLFNKVIDDYRKLHPLVTFEWVDYGNDLGTKLEQSWNGTNAGKNSTPDLVLLNPTDFYQFASAGQLESLNDYNEFSSKRDSYVPAALQAYKINSSYYGIPWLATTRVMVVNKKLWQQAELDTSKLPKTLDELEGVLSPLAKKTPGDVTAVWMKPDPLVDFMMEDLPLYQPGPDGKSLSPAFNNPVIQGRWNFYVNHLKDLALSKEALDDTSQVILDRFARGNIAVWMNGGEGLVGLKTKYPDIYNQNILVSLYPTTKPGILPYISKGVWSVPKAANTEHKAVALDFATLLDNDQNQLAFAKATAPYIYVPTVSKALSDPYITNTSDPLGQARNVIVGALPNTRPPEKTLPYPLSADARGKLVNALMDAQRKMWTGALPPPEALFEADKTWNDVLKTEAQK